MKKYILISSILCLAIQYPTWSQEADSLMSLVLENNRELKAAREAYQVSILESGVGNTPADPEVGFGYLFGKPEDLGTRIDFEVSQQVDFPTVYAHRSTIRKIKDSKAQLKYQLVRQEVLTQTRQLWIEQVHLNQLQAVQMERYERAKAVLRHVQQKKEAGEVSPMEFSHAQLMQASTEGEYEEVLSRIENNRLALETISGGNKVMITQSRFPSQVKIVPDSLLADYLEGPGAKLYQYDLEQMEAQKSLAVSEHLPKFSAGYFSETVTNAAFRGIKLGISLPLWEKARTVQMAQSEIAHADAEFSRFLAEQEKELRQKLTDRDMLKNRVEKMEKALGAINTLDLLAFSLENGEISLTEYFYASDFYFRNQQLLLRYQRDLLSLEADLLKIYF